MKAIVLAAGEGQRLRPLTENKPKCLVEVGGKSILDHQIETFKRCGIQDIVVTKGYRADKIKRADVKHYVNEKYDVTNMVMTLWCAQEEMQGDVIVSYGDIIYNDGVLRSVMDAPYDISVVVDMDWLTYWGMRFEDPLKDAEAFKMDAEGKINIIGQVANEISDIDAGYIGLIKFSAKGCQIFKDSFINARLQAQQGQPAWGISKPFEKAYMTDMLQGLINEGNDVYAVKIKGGWCEIDNLKDLELAHQLCCERDLS